MRLLSWNLLNRDGATVTEVSHLIERHQPDLLLLQEATPAMDTLVQIVGGFYIRPSFERAQHGPAVWSSSSVHTLVAPLAIAGRFDFPAAIFRPIVPRVALIVGVGKFTVANVHLDHGQLANRRQLRHLLEGNHQLNVIIGDYNALGRISLSGFADVGPHYTTHRAYGILPLRLDRCLADKTMKCTEAKALEYSRSDHKPILVDLNL